MKVYVYFNLHKQCLSVKALTGEQRGRVVAHAQAVELEDVEFRVSEAGRQRVLKEKCKNVHAGVVGQLRGIDKVLWLRPARNYRKPLLPTEAVQPVTYNPYKYATFVDRSTEHPVLHARKTWISGRDIMAAL